jgi:fatty acid desaturase
VIATYHVRFPAPLEFLWNDINWHLAHHIRTNIPWYHLREATEAIRRSFPDFVQERRFHLRDLVTVWKHPIVAKTADGLLQVASIHE